ncbi:hypothetical protein EIM50_13650 [Pseudoxanthomonas sp. SGD-10]|nr:hypothetical protein EIM50_13650 [Pseudoxanthomonas sp. SGD-10]
MVGLLFWALAVLSCSLLAGCISVPPAPTRDEWEAIHIRSFPGRSPREVLDAVEKVLRAADHDFRFEYPGDRLVATRQWTVYAVLVISSGTDYWTIETREVDGLTQASVMVTRQVATVMPSPTVNSGGVNAWGAQSSTTPGAPYQGRASYDLFWDRVAAVLEGKPWVSCDERKKSLPRKERGGLDLLCSVTTDDNRPS